MTTQMINTGHSTYLAEIDAKKSIAINGNKFVIGDLAEYDSYNLSYTGVIRQITEKTVSIEAYPGTQNAKIHRLRIAEFAWRNYDFNAERVAAENADTMMYI